MTYYTDSEELRQLGRLFGITDPDAGHEVIGDAITSERDTLRAALRVAERALLSDPPNGPQKSIYGDGVIYHLDGQLCGHALQVVRAALLLSNTGGTGNE